MIRCTHCLLTYCLVALVCLFPGRAIAGIDDDVRAILKDKILAKAEVGVSIVRLGDTPANCKPVFRHESDIPLIPASNLKLVTTSAALSVLGADFKFRTLLVQRGEDLILVGDGDPSLGDVELLKKFGWDVDTVFKNWAAGLKQRGITTVRNVLVDDSIFDQEFLHPNWNPKQQHLRYVAQVGGVNLNANALDFFITPGTRGERVAYRTNPVTRYVTVKNDCRGGNESAVWLSREIGRNDIILKGEIDRANGEPISVTIHDPPLFAATVLAETLQREGIAVSGTVSRDLTVRDSLTQSAPTTGPSSTVVAMHETPLATVLARANKDSMNVYAEALCKRVGAAVSKSAGSWKTGHDAMTELLRTSGVKDGEFSFDDGCGLSRENKISPGAITAVLAHDFTSPTRDFFLASLAVGGVDGTLDKRFRDDLSGRVFAKSGFINRVSCLSGFVKTKSDQWYAFSILMNEVTSGDAKRLQEKIVAAIDKNAP